MASDRFTGLALRDTWPVSLVLVLFGGFAALLCFHRWPFWVSWHELSDLGSAFNILAALFSGLAFAGLIITILIQARELRLQREQLAAQRTELAAQRTEMARLADAQDAQNYALLFSAFAAAEAFEQRATSAPPSPEFADAIRYARARLKEETARRRRAPET